MQVGTLLVSASYGIGFLFGSGEYALRHGMGGAIYGVATAVGMIAMATFAGRLWRTGRAVWDLFGDRGGVRVRRLVALLSIVWMAGVLAAQIYGAVAVTRLLGLEVLPAYGVAVGLIFTASRFDLRVASTVFTACLAASVVVLVYALFRTNGVALYAASLPCFVGAMPSIGLAQSVTVAIAVGLLVCTGADYHQFVLAARGPRAAIRGCLLAGVALLMLAFLPPAVVLASIADVQWPGIADPKQVVPQALFLASRDLLGPASVLMLGILGVAALGSGAAILRAMVSALQSAHNGTKSSPPAILAAVALGVAAMLTASGLPIVDTMVSVNVVYIASVGVSLAGLVLERGSGSTDETWVIAVGFTFAAAAHLAHRLVVPVANIELVALVAGLAAAAVTRWGLRRQVREQTRGSSPVRQG